ncbi:MAG: hypothetical protein R6X14_04730, partial [bacterium]
MRASKMLGSLVLLLSVAVLPALALDEFVVERTAGGDWHTVNPAVEPEVVVSPGPGPGFTGEPPTLIDYVSAQNGDWSSTATWSPAGIPGASDNVTINHQVTVSSNQVVNNITIGSGGTLVISIAYTLSVYGDWTNNGTATLTNGYVAFVGTAAAAIGGSNATTFYRLLINKGALGTAVTMNADVTVSYTSSAALTITQGTLNTNGNDLAVNSGSARVEGSNNGKLLIQGGSTVNIYYLYQWGLGYCEVRDPATTVNIGRHDIANSMHRFDISAGTLNYTTTGTTQNLQLYTNNVGWGWFATGGTITFNGSARVGNYVCNFQATDSAVIRFAGSVNSTIGLHAWASGSPRVTWWFNDLRIEKTGGTGVTFSSGTAPTDSMVRASSLTVNSGATLTFGAPFTADRGYYFGEVTNSGTMTLGAPRYWFTGDWAGAGALAAADSSVVTYAGAGAGSVALGSGGFHGLAVNAAGSLAMAADLAVPGNLAVSAGTFATGEHTLTLGGASAPGGVTVGNGGTFAAVGSGTDARAGVSAFSAAHPWAFVVQSGGTIAAGYADFALMNENGLTVAAGAAIDETDNFSYCSFDHGSNAGPMLKFENDAVDTIVDLVFNGSAGYNIEKLGATGRIGVLGGGGNRWGDSYENDPNGRVDWIIPYADAEVLSISQPSGTYQLGDYVTPVATWRNNSTLAASFEAWAKLVDPGGATVYAEKVDILGLEPGGSIQIGTFPSYQLNTAGNWVARCSTYLAGDEVPDNDV